MPCTTWSSWRYFWASRLITERPGFRSRRRSPCWQSVLSSDDSSGACAVINSSSSSSSSSEILTSRRSLKRNSPRCRLPNGCSLPGLWSSITQQNEISLRCGTTSTCQQQTMFMFTYLKADCMNAAQISTQLSPLNLLSLLKSAFKQISLHDTNTFSMWVRIWVTYYENNDSYWSVMTSYININTVIILHETLRFCASNG